MNKRWLYHGTMYTWRELLLIVAALALVSGCTSTSTLDQAELRELDASIIKTAARYFELCAPGVDSEACSDANKAKVIAVVLAIHERRLVEPKHLGAISSTDSAGYAWVLEQQRQHQHHQQRPLLQQPAARTHREMMCASNPFEC